jgi:hypothetical protein
MNTTTLKALTFAIALAGGIGVSSSAMATSTTNIPAGVGVQQLNLPNGVDVWTFTCPIFFPRGRATVQDEIVPFNVPARLQVTLQQWGVHSLPQTDLSPPITGGEGLLSSPAALANGVAGIPYIAVFNKTAGGPERYTGNLYCVNAFGIRFNPVITRLLNQ